MIHVITPIKDYKKDEILFSVDITAISCMTVIFKPT